MKEVQERPKMKPGPVLTPERERKDSEKF